MKNILNKSIFLFIKLVTRSFNFLPVHFMYYIYKKRSEFFLKSLSSEEGTNLIKSTSNIFRKHKMVQ